MHVKTCSVLNIWTFWTFANSEKVNLWPQWFPFDQQKGQRIDRGGMLLKQAINTVNVSLTMSCNFSSEQEVTQLCQHKCRVPGQEVTVSRKIIRIMYLIWKNLWNEIPLQMLTPTISKKAKLNYLTSYLHFLKSYKIINSNFMACR